MKTFVRKAGWLWGRFYRRPLWWLGYYWRTYVLYPWRDGRNQGEYWNMED